MSGGAGVDWEFDELINSLGHMTLDRVSGCGVAEIRILANQDLGTAEVVACVPEALPDVGYANLFDRLLSVQEFYLDELSIDFLISRGSPDGSSIRRRSKSAISKD